MNAHSVVIPVAIPDVFPEASAEVSPFRAQMFRDAGWQYLLDLRRSGAVLCYDCTGGAASLLLAGLYPRLTVIHAQPSAVEKIRQRLSAEGLDDPHYRTIAAAGDHTGLAQAPFAGLVIHDPQATLVGRASVLALGELLQAAYPLIEPGGFVYLGMRNRFSYTRLRAGAKDEAYRRSLSLAAGKAALRAAGFGQLRAHPFLLEGSRLAEVIPRRGYQGSKNRFTLSEKFKAGVLGTWGGRYFASGYGLVAHKGGATAPACSLGRLLDAAAVYGMPLAPGRLELKRYVSLNWGKVLLSVGKGASRQGEYVFVLTSTAEATLRRRREAGILQALKNRALGVAAYFPEFVGEFAVDGARCFVLREFPGVTFDRPAPALGRLARCAVDFIVRLHAETASPRRIDEAGYRQYFGALFGKARVRHPAVAAELESLEAAVRQAVTGCELPLVWLHGDYKIENMIFDDRGRELVGVIDWEHSEAQGLPLLDLLYLLVYGRTFAAGAALLAALDDLVLHGPRQEEAPLLQRYTRALSLGSALEPALRAMFLVHHIGARYQYGIEDAGRLGKTLGLLERAVRGTPAR